MRISDWSSDVCSSDLPSAGIGVRPRGGPHFSARSMFMASAASDIARALARSAEVVCRHYLREGRREGKYWIVGDAYGSPGRSLYVRLKRSEEHTSELQSLMRISYAVFCLKTTNKQ